MSLRNKLIISALVLSGLVGAGKFIDSNYLLRPDFKKAEKIQYENPSGKIWDAYMGENVPRNRFNWDAYKIAVSEMNPNGLEGTIYLPDLDKNGKVGKDANKLNQSSN